MSEPREDWRTAVQMVGQYLQGISGWMISGSCAMASHGLRCSPADVDVWCMPDAFQAVACRLEKQAEIQIKSGLICEALTTKIGGWDVEIVGRVRSSIGFEMLVDGDMIAASMGSPPVEAASDLVAELVLLDRPAPKSDIERAKRLWHVASSGIDRSYLIMRLKRFGLTDAGIAKKLDLLAI